MKKGWLVIKVVRYLRVYLVPRRFRFPSSPSISIPLLPPLPPKQNPSLQKHTKTLPQNHPVRHPSIHLLSKVVKSKVKLGKIRLDLCPPKKPSQRRCLNSLFACPGLVVHQIGFNVWKRESEKKSGYQGFARERAASGHKERRETRVEVCWVRVQEKMLALVERSEEKKASKMVDELRQACARLSSRKVLPKRIAGKTQVAVMRIEELRFPSVFPSRRCPRAETVTSRRSLVVIGSRVWCSRSCWSFPRRKYNMLAKNVKGYASHDKGKSWSDGRIEEFEVDSDGLARYKRQ